MLIDPNLTQKTKHRTHEVSARGHLRRPDEVALAEARCPICSQAKVDTFRREMNALAAHLEVLDAVQMLDSATSDKFYQLVAAEDVPRLLDTDFLREAA